MAGIENKTNSYYQSPDGVQSYLGVNKTKCNNKKIFFCGFGHSKMHCEFTYTTNSFQDESWDLSNSKGYEGSRKITLWSN